MTKPRANTGRILPAAALVAAPALVAAGLVQAQVGGVWDASTLPETKGTVRQYTLTPRGDVDGLILADGTEVKLPPHMTGQVVFAIKPGDAVTIRGMRARALPLVDAATIRNDATGATVADAGPPDRSGEETTLTGRIAMPLHGKRGEVNGALLEDGTVLRLPPPEALRWSAALAKGQSVSVRGVVARSPLGTLVDVRALGATPAQMTELDRKPPKPPKPPGPRGEGAFGPGAAPPPPPAGPEPAPRG